jgi:excinuclease ABC subunit A
MFRLPASGDSLIARFEAMKAPAKPKAKAAPKAAKSAMPLLDARFDRAITVRGAREHNLKNVDLTIPRDKLVVFTGLSGSGKSSLAFDTIYAEGQRRYVESLSAYARQFLEMMQKPDVDQIDGLSPAISIEQKTTSKNPRSTVGTVTEIYDYMRLLWARVGIPYSPATGLPIESQTVSQMVDRVLALPEKHAALSARARRARPQGRIPQGNRRFHETRLPAHLKIDGAYYEIADAPALDKKLKHDIDVVVDRIVVRADMGARLAESFETALELADGIAVMEYAEAAIRLSLSPRAGNQGEGPDESEDVNGEREKVDPRRIVFSSKFACPVSGFTIPEIEPRLFSFNNPFGACPACGGLGSEQKIDADLIVPDAGVTLRKGAIAPWAKSTSPYYLQTLDALGKHFRFRLDDAVRETAEKGAARHPLRHRRSEHSLSYDDGSARLRGDEAVRGRGAQSRTALP